MIILYILDNICNKKAAFSLLDLLDHLVHVLDIILQYLPLFQTGQQRIR